MPDLKHRLQNQDLGFLEIVADFWGLALNAPDARAALPKLVKGMLNPDILLEVVEALPDPARRALETLQANEGWLPWPRFSRAFGPLREVGPGKRDREQPHLNPVSAAEVLWYRGLIGRDFLRRAGELQECAYIPDGIRDLLPPPQSIEPGPPGQAASSDETIYKIPATDRILDHCCTLLAALRLGDPGRSPAADTWQPPLPVVHALLGAVRLISSEEQPVPEDARPFLEMPRSEALAWLVQGWRASDLFNELRLTPSLTCEGAWRNDPQTTRETVLDLLRDLPAGQWWQLDSFIEAIRERQPDFQRPAGDYDSWLIQNAQTGDSLIGEEHWDDVDGALLRYLITGPMHWLGLMDLAAPEADAAPAAFRFSEWADALLQGGVPPGLAAEDQPFVGHSDGQLTVPRLTPRLARYQVSRFGEWLDETESTYTYRLTPESLGAAAAQGLKVSHLETLFSKFGEEPPPSLITALENWEQKGQRAEIAPGIVLQVSDPKVLQALRDTPASRFLGTPLGPTAILVHKGAVEKVRKALARLGTLSEVDFTDPDETADEPED
ncbi:helicase-associated domain-containing protein [bacterium]|nr:helicase-associated domain-containing protein [bacterium]